MCTFIWGIIPGKVEGSLWKEIMINTTHVNTGMFGQVWIAYWSDQVSLPMQERVRIECRCGHLYHGKPLLINSYPVWKRVFN